MTEPRFKSREEYEAWKAAGAPLTPIDPTSPTTPSAPSVGVGAQLLVAWRVLPRWLKVVVILALLSLIGGLMQQTNPPRPTSRADDGFDGWSACTRAVAERLKAPSTARFHGPTASWHDQAKGTGWIRGQVDAQNSFGAMLRSTFECGLQRNDGYWGAQGVRIEGP
jgi:hypothetical protein